LTYQLEPFSDLGLDESLLNHLIEEHEAVALPEYDRYWSYYRNPAELVEVVDRAGRRWEWKSFQASCLPARLQRQDPSLSPKEIVVENDIAWRLQAQVDYIAGREVKVVSTADRPDVRERINGVLEVLLDEIGGLTFVQDMVLLGCLYGHVDLLLRSDRLVGGEGGGLSGGLSAGVPSEPSTPRELSRALSMIKLETVEAPRAIPLPNPHDYKVIDAYIIRYRRWLNTVDQGGFLSRLGSWSGLTGGAPHRQRGTVDVTEILSASHRQVYEDGELILDEPNLSGVLPVFHVQNGSQPYFYEGVSEVEPLIPLQDELNTRLSDRANRVTLQSFKMYLGKGIDGFGDRPIGPGQMWMTDNMDASIEEFGGDSDSPSETAHIREVREAMDKVSSVSPLAAGVISGSVKLGTLSSENAMRISLLGILSKVERKRKSYGHGLSRAFEMVLSVLDQVGVLSTTPDERGVEVVWTTPIPEDQSKRLADALIKRDLGVPQDRLLSELGYGPEDGVRLNMNKGEEAHD